MTYPPYRLLTDAEWEAIPNLYDTPTLKWPSSVLDGRTYDEAPLLLNEKGQVIDAPTSWLKGLLAAGAKPLTVKQYAYSLRIFWQFLGARDWTLPSSALLREWRNEMVATGKSGRRINLCIDAVVMFYRWAQAEGHVINRIGATPSDGQPFPVRLIRRRGRRSGLVCDVRAEVVRTSRLPVPDISELDDLYVRLTGPDEALSERNCLIADLAVECGLRRSEIISLNTADVPSHSAIAKCRRENKPHSLSVTGKGSKTRQVPLLPELATRLRHHVDGHRKQLLGPTTRDKGALFISKKTGDRLTEYWVSRLFSNAFGGSKRSKLGLHRLRARFASLLVLVLARREMKSRGLTGIRDDMVLMTAADVLGHGDTRTLERYVDLAIRTLKAEATGASLQTVEPGIDVDVLREVSRQNAKDPGEGRREP